MRIVVDYNLCQSHAQCVYTAPQLFEIDKDGYQQVLIPEPGEEWRELAEEAAQRCPMQAITIED